MLEAASVRRNTRRKWLFHVRKGNNMLPFFGPELIAALCDLFDNSPISEKKMPTTNPAGKTALAAGASSGSGAAVAKETASRRKQRLGVKKGNGSFSATAPRQGTSGQKPL
jgi:hypothetical protein